MFLYLALKLLCDQVYSLGPGQAILPSDVERESGSVIMGKNILPVGSS